MARPRSRLETIFDYPDRFDRYHTAGYLSDGDRDALGRLLARCGEPDQVNRGDAVPSNVILLPDGSATLLDWEFTGNFLPGFDLAMLHTLFGAATPSRGSPYRADRRRDGHQRRVSQSTSPRYSPRELRIHRELPDTQLRRTRLPLIDAAWVHARHRLHQLASKELMQAKLPGLRSARPLWSRRGRHCPGPTGRPAIVPYMRPARLGDPHD